jgi:MFS transporter, Spinster family, sphingosine-1-phosphate transporter
LSEVTVPESSAPATPGAGKRAGRYAAYVFWLMFLINFINYFDRFIFSTLGLVIRDSLRLNDFYIGLAGSAFLLIYTVVALPGGFLADRIARKTIVALGVAIWSVASFATGLASNALTLIGIRGLLGIGEGSYYPAGTPLLAAYYPPARRPRVFSRWTVGALLGAAVGVLAAGFFTQGESWRNAFFFTGLPGLILAVLIFSTRNKTRHEDDPATEQLGNEGTSPLRRFVAYLRIPTMRTIILTQALGFFATTGAVTFFVIYMGDTFAKGAPGFPKAGLSLPTVTTLAGAIVLLGGILGTIYGSYFAERLSRRYSGGRVLAGALGFLLAAPAVVVAIGARYVLNVIPAYTAASESTRLIIGVAIFSVAGLAAAFCLNLFQGPLTAAVLDVVPANERAGAGGTNLALSHLLGDSYAGALIGAVSVLLSNILGGKQIGLAMLVTMPIALVASGIIGIRGSRHYAADVAAVGASVDVTLGASITPAH